MELNRRVCEVVIVVADQERISVDRIVTTYFVETNLHSFRERGCVES